MSAPDQIANQEQLTRLYDCFELGANIHGVAFGTGVVWSLAEVTLPEAVRTRSAIGLEEAEGYGFMAFAPRLVQDSQLARLFEGTSLDTNTMTLNFRQRTGIVVNSPKPWIQYRLRHDNLTNVVLVDKLYPGEPVDFSILDDEETRKQRELQAAELREELSDLPEDPSDFSDQDLLRAAEAVGGVLMREFEENQAKRKRSEDFARSLGLTAVFADEVDSLIEFVGSLS